MRKRLVKSLVLVSCICCIFISGCEALDSGVSMSYGIDRNSDSNETKENLMESLGLTPQFSYDIQKMEAAIKVDQVGYRPSQTKIAVFEGDELPDIFEVVDMVQREVVFSGTIEKKNMFGYGDFSALDTEGRYLIRAERIGYSYPFSVQEDLYDPLMKDALKQFYYSRCGTSLPGEFAGMEARNACHTSLSKLQDDMKTEVDVSGGWHMDEKGNRFVTGGCDAMQGLLLAYELNASNFSDDVELPESGDTVPDLLNEVQYEAAWLLKMQDASSGGVYDGVRTTDGDYGNASSYVQSISLDASLRFAAVMAKFSYLYQSYDTAFATQCLKAADRAYRYVGHYKEEADQALLFRAAVELYRATGYATYRKDAEAYLNQQVRYNMEEGLFFDGCVTYLFTKQKVDTGLCEKIITELMRYVEKLSYTSRQATYLAGSADGEDVQTMLREASRIAVVNYVITNNEYDRILENYLHYFLGCNAQTLCYVGQLGQNNAADTMGSVSIINQAENDAYWILLVSVINKN